MEHNEILTEMEMDYETLVGYLKVKYGAAKCDYFTNAMCNTRSKRITRTKEGLFCHHIDEDKGCNLGESNFAREQPYEYQKSERLVYCNYLEHLLLHIRIGKDKYWKEHESFTFPKEFAYFIVPGITYICAEINDLFEENGSSVEWRNRCFKEIECNFDDYIYILKSFVKYMVERYAGNKEQKTIYVGQHIRHKRLGEGVITKITGEELFDFVTVKFADCEKTVLRNVIDKGGYEETLIQVKKKLSSNRNQEIINLIYEKLQ